MALAVQGVQPYKHTPLEGRLDSTRFGAVKSGCCQWGLLNLYN